MLLTVDQVRQELDEIERQRKDAFAASVPTPCVDFVDKFLSIAAHSGFLEAQLEQANWASMLVLTGPDGQQYRYDWASMFRTCLANMAAIAYGLSGREAAPSEFSFYGFEAVVNYPLEEKEFVPLHIKTLNSGHSSVPEPHFYFCIRRQ